MVLADDLPRRVSSLESRTMMGEKTTFLSHWGYKGYNNAEKHGPPRWWQYGQERGSAAKRHDQRGSGDDGHDPHLGAPIYIHDLYATFTVALRKLGFWRSKCRRRGSCTLIWESLSPNAGL